VSPYRLPTRDLTPVNCSLTRALSSAETAAPPIGTDETLAVSYAPKSG
jgi:hypothetical protein